MDDLASAVPVRVQRVEGGRLSLREDVVVTEEPLEVRLVIGAISQTISVTMRTPGNDFDLAAGFLFTEAVIQDRDSIQNISYCSDISTEHPYNVVNVTLHPWASPELSRAKRNFYTTSSCGVCGKASLDAVRLQVPGLPKNGGPRVSPEVVLRLPGELRRAQVLFHQTGGLHAAGLFTSEGALLSVREDVGRHNAVDKLLGEQFLKGRTPLSEGVLALSGRASFELLQKAAMAGIPVVVAVGAPSSLAVDLAKELGITLVGFVGRGGFNVYAGQERITI